ncbi:MAG TPA: ATP-binding protein [Draconibacterium sp.]|nr:ATP-binding protein [Draconibacterium sp.]
MNKILSLIVCTFFALESQGQNKVQFILKEKTAIHHDSIYLTGTFNNWDSIPNMNYLMRPNGENEKSIVLNLPNGVIKYKFHRGSWFTVEKKYNGYEVKDGMVIINRDTILKDSVVSWRDELILDKKYKLLNQNEDTGRVSILAGIAFNYAFWSESYNSDSALFYANEALQLQQKIINSKEPENWEGGGQVRILFNLQEMLARLFHSLGNYPKALELRLGNLDLAEKEKNNDLMIPALRNITIDFNSMYDYQNTLRYGILMDSVLNTLNPDYETYNYFKFSANSIIANAYYNLDIPDSALYFANKNATIKTDDPVEDAAFNNLLLGNIYAKKGFDSIALFHYRQVYPNAIQIYNPQVAASGYEGMAKLFQKQGNSDSALYYAKRALTYLQQHEIIVVSWGENSDSYVAEISPMIAELYKAKNQPDSAFKYLQLSVTLKDKLYNAEKLRQFQTLSFNEIVRRQQLEQQNRDSQLRYKTKLKMYGLVSGMMIFLAISFLLFRNNKQKQKANIRLKEQKEEIQSTLNQLKSTQAQLIQSEKMASLGELTAGIAHEIQNPLNFVNNFSELSNELIDEMKEEQAAGNWQLATDIADDIKQNLEKINHHGKRADAIVKGMLQHSRTSSGQKEPTDINALADEYLRLAYHGLRAKDKSFNADFKTNFDPNLPKINVIPQDIGRVLLNLINNAFYAAPLPPEGGFKDPNYIHKPTVTVSTSFTPPSGGTRGAVLITVKDNGPGIPTSIIDKIFQPFFTTKPTGQGTGLGLSLSYDIVKAHGGELKVETKEGFGSEFVIQIPIN